MPATIDKTLEPWKKNETIIEAYKNKNDCYNRKIMSSELDAGKNVAQIAKTEREEHQNIAVASQFKNYDTIKHRDCEIDNKYINLSANKPQKSASDSHLSKINSILPNKIETEVCTISKYLTSHQIEYLPQITQDKTTAHLDIQSENKLKKSNLINYKEGRFELVKPTFQANIVSQSTADKQVTKKIEIPSRLYDKVDTSGKSNDINYFNIRLQQDYNKIDLPQKRVSNCESNSSRICKKFKSGSRDIRNFSSRYNDKTKSSNCKDRYQSNQSYDKPLNPQINNQFHKNSVISERTVEENSGPKSSESKVSTNRSINFSSSSKPPKSIESFDIPKEEYKSVAKPITSSGSFILSQEQVFLDNRNKENQYYVTRPLSSMISPQTSQSERLTSDSSNYRYSNNPMSNSKLSKLPQVEELLRTNLTQDYTKNGTQLQQVPISTPKDTIIHTLVEKNKMNPLIPINPNLITHRSSLNDSPNIEKCAECLNLNDQIKSIYKVKALINENSIELQNPREQKCVLRSEIPDQNTSCKSKINITLNDRSNNIRNSTKTLYKGKDSRRPKKCIQRNLITNYFPKLHNFPML